MIFFGVLFFVGAISTGPLLAEQSVLGSQASAAPTQSVAETKFREGIRQYDSHDYLRALESFEAAYALAPASEILFDIGQTYRALGNCQKALDRFDAFIAIANPDDSFLPRARARQLEMRSCAGAEPHRPAPTEGPVRLATVAAPISKPLPPALLDLPRDLAAEPSRSQRTASRTVCFSALGGGLALGTLGAVLAVKARAAETDVASRSVWDESAQRADERGRTLSTMSITLLTTAGVAAAVGATACWLGWRREGEP